MRVTSIYTDASCSSSAVNVRIISSANCSASACEIRPFGDSTRYYEASTCSSSETEANDPMEQVFAGQDFVEGRAFSDANCSADSYLFRQGLVVGNCQPFQSANNHSVSVTVADDGSAALIIYNNTDCTAPPMTTYAIQNNTLANHLCYEGISNTGEVQYIAKYYKHTDYASSSVSGSSSEAGVSDPGRSISATSGQESGAIATATGSGSSDNDPTLLIGIGIGCVVLLLGIAALLLYCHWRKNPRRSCNDSLAVVESDFESDDKAGRRAWTLRRFTHDSSAHSALPPHTSERSWDDDIIVAARLPRDRVVVETLVNRGAFGEVYEGAYNGQRVAIKMLLPDSRRSIPHVNAFLAEVKMAAIMEHPHIVQFLGVAWDSLSDMCSLFEFMPGGDLRALLMRFERRNYLVGFNANKVKIAYQVAHALTYLHSLDLPVIHRDLKSRNILLSDELDAKLTDFGISRERVDQTMTAGVGTSLWMAPEVMIGDRYDDKADMFSFGVVLSELDTHSLPYSHARRSSTSRREITDAAVLQLVAAGELRVEFSEASPMSIVDLGLACVSMDPEERPSAAQALYRLHRILTQEVM
ncbi:hypothetical protein BBJ28_00022390 [Nothophytophthora sp. Chile5]|nr:hypothetical protein BBJ28_00022390 [Nothophytophthora sp. Chile5]